MFAIVNMWWIISFPSKKSVFVVNERKIHVWQSIIAWGVPAILSLTVLLNNGYSHGPFDRKFCAGSSMAWSYFTLILPQQIIAAISMSLLIWIFYQLQQKVRTFYVCFHDLSLW